MNYKVSLKVNVTLYSVLNAENEENAIAVLATAFGQAMAQIQKTATAELKMVHATAREASRC